MLNKKRILSIIPARGGSKRLPAKNLTELAGKPLIAWTIEAALSSRYIDDIIVTSDNDDILNVAHHYGVDALRRPAHLSDDYAKSIDVCKHALEEFKAKNNCLPEYTILLQPTSPLRKGVHINAAMELLARKSADAVVSVTASDHSPLWMNVLPEDKSMKNFINKSTNNLRSQDLATYFRINGAIYICNTDRLFRENSFFICDNIYAFEMDRSSSVDIDELIDLKFAEFLMKN